MYCEKCGKYNDNTNQYCQNCGSGLINDNKNNSLVNDKKIKKKKKLWKKLLIFLLIILVIVGFIKLNSFIQEKYNNNKIVITSFKSSSLSGDKLFIVDEKMDNLSGKINTFKKVRNGHIKIYVGDLVLVDKDLDKKSFDIKNFNLAKGINKVDITYTVKDQTIVESFYILNNSDENVGNLDSYDLDNDKIPNYLEEAFVTNKNLIDTDNDGLTDYEEIYIVHTNPSIAKTYGEILDSDYDSDKDGLSNLEEIKLKTSPIIKDTDGDGLIDGIEVLNGTDPLKVDTDGDTLTDYHELNNFNTSPVEYNDSLSGNVSDIKNVVLNVSNIKVNDLEKVQIIEGGYVLLNESMSGYILPPYKINSLLDTAFTIGFDLNNFKLSEDAKPVIYEIDSNTQQYKEIDSVVKDGIITATVNNIDNLYMVYDKNELSKVSNNITPDLDKIDIEVPETNHYLMFDSPLARIVSSFLGTKMPSIKIYCYGTCDVSSHNTIEKIIEEKLDNTIDIIFIKVDGFKYNVIKKMYNAAIEGIKAMLEMFFDADVVDGMYKELSVINPNSKAITIFNALDYFEFVGLEDVGTYFFGENFDDFMVEVEINLSDDTDTNNDGINDCLTELIIWGYITTKEGYNPFKGLTLEQINRNKDFDRDGIINSEEISIEIIDGSYVIVMKSDPTKKDGDGDGIEDKKDPRPLQSFDSRYMLRDSLKGEPSNIWKLEKEVEGYNSLYNTGRILINGKYIEDLYSESDLKLLESSDDKESTKKMLNFMYLENTTVFDDVKIEYTDTDGKIKYNDWNNGNLGFSMMYMLADIGHVVGLKDAAKAEDMYWSATGEPFTEDDVSDELIKAEDIKRYMNKEINNYISLAKSAVADGETLVFENKEFGTSTAAYGGSFENIIVNLNSIMFLHYASNNSIAQVSNKKGVYTIKLRYFIEDVYDWKKEPIEGDSTSEIEVSYFNRLLYGAAKAFLVHIEYDAEIIYDSNTGTENITIHETPIYK